MHPLTTIQICELDEFLPRTSLTRFNPVIVEGSSDPERLIHETLAEIITASGFPSFETAIDDPDVLKTAEMSDRMTIRLRMMIVDEGDEKDVNQRRG